MNDINLVIGDAMYASVVLRFNTYRIRGNWVAAEYVETVLQQPAIQEWLAASKLEQKIINAAEL